MSKGLRQTLNEIIEREGYLTIQQVYNIAAEQGHKQRTAERELNPSHSPDILTVKNEKGHIVGYKWSGVCCSSKSLLGTCSRECERSRIKAQPATQGSLY